MKRFLWLIFVPMVGFGQTAIYRSVQNKTSAIASPANMSISGSTMTVSALPDSIGVGDAVQYDSTGASGAINAICFIHTRSSSTSYIVKRFNGGTPASCTASTNSGIYRAFTTINNAENRNENTGIDVTVRNFDSGTTRNISTANEQWHFAIYRGNAGNFSWDSWTTPTTDNQNYIRVFAPSSPSEVGVTQRHVGFFNAGRAYFSGNSSLSGVAQIRFEGMQFSLSSIDYGINFIGSVSYKARVESIIIKGGSVGIYFQLGASGATVKISNSIFHDQGSGGSDSGILSQSANYTSYIYNCSIVSQKYGINRVSGTVIVKNTLSKCGSNDFNGTLDATSDYNASADATAPGSNSRLNQTFTFVNEAGKVYLLDAGDAGAKNYGTNLSGDSNLAVTVDILGTSRPQGAAFDIGAHEIIIDEPAASHNFWRRRLNR